jgi:hypothetical protein
MWTHKTLTVIAVLLLAVLADCGDDDKGTNSSGNEIPSELVGTWILPEEFTVIVNGDTLVVQSKEFLEWEPNTVSVRITIDDNGSFTWEELDSEGTVVYDTTGTVSVSGDTITATSIKFEVNSAIWSVKGNQLTLTVYVKVTDYLIYTYVFILTKEPSS